LIHALLQYMYTFCSYKILLYSRHDCQ
jgi:hypothetical protein